MLRVLLLLRTRAMAALSLVVVDVAVKVCVSSESTKDRFGGVHYMFKII